MRGITVERLNTITFDNVCLNQGFWHKRQIVNSNTTIYAIYDRFMETGIFDALKFDWKPGDPPPHIFWDSDIAKWIEAAAHVCQNHHDEKLIGLIEGMIDQIERHQDSSGYFNIWFTVGDLNGRWQTRTAHELYCAGHLIEAAVAYYHTTGRDRLMNIMCRYADHIEKIFVQDRSATFKTPGHEEIELALVKLYHATKNKRYLDLAKYFVDSRSQDGVKHYYKFANAKYTQDHLPAREQFTAEGHAVRATYLYCAMADLAKEYGDQELLTACRCIFDDIACRKMYITGGIGSSCNGEAFTISYDLPNLTAYTESCAAIGLAFFARRMLNIDIDSKYADVIERVMYNAFLSSISLAGDAFFYENPLEIDPRLQNRDTSIIEGQSKFPLTQRLSMFKCACCPPNISRFIGSIGEMLYSYSDDTLYVHQYMNSQTVFTLDGRKINVTQETGYPNKGTINLTVYGMKGRTLAVRIPGWCSDWRIWNGEETAGSQVDKGYAYIICTEEDTQIRIELAMEPQLIEATPYVQDDSGRVALQRGPLVYCLEAGDNGINLRDIAISPNPDYQLTFDALYGTHIIEAEGIRRNASDFDGLYQTAASKRVKQLLKFIPYFGFANHGEREMIVWILAH